MSKSHENKWAVKEQIIEDPATGLTIQFEVLPSGEPRLRMFGDGLAFGNREFMFDVDGNEAGAGTATSLCRPTWMVETE